eukprot:1456852-Prorocentrum_lima.AAC.1
MVAASSSIVSCDDTSSASFSFNKRWERLSLARKSFLSLSAIWLPFHSMPKILTGSVALRFQADE